ncbi:MAG TPA: hypothetical protein VGR21_04115, partial [Cryptosporangiaceae bacterium]|nr:hypothetical protein [Cryptosporangiaceae bacterium]
MSREAQSIVLLLVGGAILRISAFSDVYLRYVKEGLRWYLVVAGVLLVAVGVVTLWREVFSRRALAAYSGRHRNEASAAGDGLGSGEAASGALAQADDHAHPDDGHGHGPGGPRVAWLLTLPVFAVFLVAPPPLGSYAASREGATAVQEPSSDFPPL